MTYSIYSTDGRWLVGSAHGDSHEDALVRTFNEERTRAGRNGSAERHEADNDWLIREDGSYIVKRQGQDSYGHGSVKLLTLTVQREPVVTATVVR